MQRYFMSTLPPIIAVPVLSYVLSIPSREDGGKLTLNFLWGHGASP